MGAAMIVYECIMGGARGVVDSGSVWLSTRAQMRSTPPLKWVSAKSLLKQFQCFLVNLFEGGVTIFFFKWHLPSDRKMKSTDNVTVCPAAPSPWCAALLPRFSLNGNRDLNTVDLLLYTWAPYFTTGGRDGWLWNLSNIFDLICEPMQRNEWLTWFKLYRVGG